MASYTMTKILIKNHNQIMCMSFLNTEDPDRPCRVACQDDEVNHRFYMVNGEDGWFPFGTDCSRGVPEKRAYCVSGKCLVRISVVVKTQTCYSCTYTCFT